MDFNKKAQKKHLPIIKIIFGIVVVGLFLSFAPKFFHSTKGELVSMNATADMRMAMRNVKQYAIKVSGFGTKDGEKLFWEAVGEEKPWWGKCFHLALIPNQKEYIKITKNEEISKADDIKMCNRLYLEPQIQKWLEEEKIYF